MAIDKPLHLFGDTRSLRLYNYTTQASYVDFLTTTAGGLTITPAVAAQAVALANTANLELPSHLQGTTTNGYVDIRGDSGATVDLRVTDAGLVLIGDTSNVRMTVGLTINQGAADDEALALKSSDVDHGITTFDETDTYASFRKYASTTGGLMVWGLSEATVGVNLEGIATTADTTKGTGARSPIHFDSLLKSGTTAGSMGANSNIASFTDNGTTRFILDADGDSHQDVGTAWTNFHGHDDVMLVEALAANVTRRNDPIRRDFHDFLFSKKDELEQLRLVTFNDDGHHFVNMSRLTMLHTGAIQQLGARSNALADVLRDILTANPGLHGADRALALLEA